MLISCFVLHYSTEKTGMGFFHAQDQRTAGILLLGLAALAIFDFWGPGLLLLLGGIIAYDGHQRGGGGGQRRLAALLLTLGGVWWLHDLLAPLGIDWLFPIVLIATGTVLGMAFDWASLLQDPDEDVS